MSWQWLVAAVTSIIGTSRSVPQFFSVTQSPQPQQIQALFDRIAPVYDQFNDQLSYGLHRVWKQMTVDWSGARPGAVCLDLCCGSGDLARLLARKAGEAGQVFGVDFSAELLAIAQQFPTPHPITWIEANALELPFADNTFDAITMGYGLRNIPNILASLAEMQRVLKPGSKAAILDFHRPASAVMKTFQQWYLDFRVVPLAEQYGLQQEYAYIMPSIERFPTGRAQVKLAQQAGFTDAVHYAIAGGMMGVLVASK
ncbi:MAG TPA: bifunctional demethylmenaquinone methyltransferase/2-methoxy-6-polyprenyl-1,4-benzoquinol methylase UbiE [Synechococcales cyanobacterium M55_K2018_004]|nr:bifunctional demethylmenaquinone methyltransferase/2-methoxy-6-polyprenyl-1,4-benzoquinol methylase UbiE [Synechococcales cyanobacterium M55_K2018_004]